MRSGRMHCHTFRYHLTEVQMWVMVAVDRHIRTDWQILAQMEKNVLELVASESQSSDEQKD